MQRLEQWLPSPGACGAPWECLGVGGRRRAEGLGAPRGAGRAQGLRSAWAPAARPHPCKDQSAA